MSLYYGFHCPRCNASSGYIFNHGEQACREILDNWRFIAPCLNLAWVKINTTNERGNEIFPFLEEHYAHGVVIETEYGDRILNQLLL